MATKASDRSVQWAARMMEERVAGRRRAGAAADAARQAGFGDGAGSLAALNPAAMGVAEEYARMGRRPVSAALSATAARLGLRFEHVGLTIGTVVHGADLRGELSGDVVAAIRATLLERKVVFFRDQHITVEQQIAFARRFGPLDAFPFGDHVAGNPLVLRIANGEKRPAMQNGWHTDVTWMEEPSLGSVLHMQDIPPTGGDTLFSDSHAAYLGLPADLREQIRGATATHDYRGFRAAQRAQGVPEETLDAMARDIPFGVRHPLVRTHPETRKQALYIHPGFIRHDGWTGAAGDEWSPSKCQRMVKVLMEWHARPEYQCRFVWQKGSVAFWDNRACQHYAVSDYFGRSRVGHRVTIGGDRPFFDPRADAVAPPPRL